MKPYIYILLSLLLLSSCKPSFNFTGGAAPNPNLKTLSVATFINEAPLAVPYLSQTFTEQLRDYFLSQSRLALTEGSADIEITGSIVGYSIAPAAIQGSETAAQNKMTVRVFVKFQNNVETSESWEQRFSSDINFSSTADFSSLERDLIEDVNEQIIQDIFNKSLGKW